MHFAILTQSAPPEICGIGDHSLKFAEALRNAGHRAAVLARRGTPSVGVEVVAGEIGPEWLATLVDCLDGLGANHLILQYTPLMFSSGRWHDERRLLRCWRNLARRWPTSLIVHETYFRVWWHPPSLLRGSIQLTMLRRLASYSRHVFTASEPLCDEMSDWRLARSPSRLPIGSNVSVAAIDVAELRQRHGITEGEIVLTLFSGGNNLRRLVGHVDMVDAALLERGVSCCWLLLGGVSRDWFDLAAPVLSPGFLSHACLSAHLQMTDIVLMPHVQGISAKRGTLMAALEHGLPVVGTTGVMTDSFWSNVEGVILVDANDVGGFAAAVTALCLDRRRQRELGSANAVYHGERFAWSRIVRKFLDVIETV